MSEVANWIIYHLSLHASWIIIIKIIKWKWFTNLPDSNDGIGDEDEKNDKRFNEGCYLLLGLFKPCKDLATTTEEHQSKNERTKGRTNL